MGIFRDIYDVVIGDSLEHKRWRERMRIMNEMAEGRDLDNTYEFNKFSNEVINRLGIRKVSECCYTRHKHS